MSEAARNEQVDTPQALEVASGQSGVLHKIIEPSVNLALWQRPPQLAIARELSSIQELNLANVRCTTSASSFDEDVVGLLTQQGVDPGALLSLRADMRELSQLFFGISNAREARFSLLTTDGDKCTRFHVDRSCLRLLCTYQGPGTEWLTDAQVDRDAQGRCLPNNTVVRFGVPSQFQTFWVGIMKGDPKNVGSGLVHRSPAIKGSGKLRVLFCLDL